MVYAIIDGFLSLYLTNQPGEPKYAAIHDNYCHLTNNAVPIDSTRI